MVKALITLDGSDTSERALGLASELLGGKEAEITLLHVIPRHLIYGKGGPVVAECYDPAAEQTHAQELLATAAERLRQHGVGSTIRTDVEIGDPADLILGRAEADNVDLIVMGSRGLNVAQRFLLGSVSTKVAAHAHCAVLIARPPVTASPAEVDEGVAAGRVPLGV